MVFLLIVTDFVYYIQYILTIIFELLLLIFETNCDLDDIPILPDSWKTVLEKLVSFVCI